MVWKTCAEALTRASLPQPDYAATLEVEGRGRGHPVVALSSFCSTSPRASSDAPGCELRRRPPAQEFPAT